MISINGYCAKPKTGGGSMIVWTESLYERLVKPNSVSAQDSEVILIC